jgi:hypothetical protein
VHEGGGIGVGLAEGEGAPAPCVTAPLPPPESKRETKPEISRDTSATARITTTAATIRRSV